MVPSTKSPPISFKHRKETALRLSARELLKKKLDAGLDDPETVSLTAAARAAETVEKVYTHSGENKEPDARSFVDRLKWMHAVAQELQSRGLDLTSEQAVTVDAVVIDAGPDQVQGQEKTESSTSLSRSPCWLAESES